MSTAESESRTERIDAAIAEWFEALEEGRAPGEAEFLARFPDVADELRKFLADHRGFGRIAGSIAGTEMPGDSSTGADPVGRRLGDFDVVREIGRGGMGIVYEAQQVSLKRIVALKVLNRGFRVDPRAVQRFRREAEAAAMLRHSGIIPIFATGAEAGLHYYAMELIPGPSLDRMSPRSLPISGEDFARIAGLMADVASALDHAHSQGIIHRDVKPSNLILAADGRLRIGDFGLARFAENPGMTLTDEILGSPAYMSPEQAAGRVPIDRRSDVYSLGVTLYEMLALRPPFTGARRDELLFKIIHDEPLPPSRWNAHVPYQLETICLKAIEKDAVRRYQSAADLARDLQHYCAGRSIAARRPGMIGRLWNWSRRHTGTTVLAVAVLLVAILASYFAHSALSTREALAQAHVQDAVDEALLANMSGDSDAADRAVARVAALAPDSGWLPFLHGHLAFQRGDYDEGVRYLQQAAERLPDSVAARALLAAAYVGAGWWERYEEILDDLEQSIPQTAEDFMFRGLAESYLDPARARASLDEAIRRRRLPAAYVMRAEVCAHQAMDTASRDAAAAAVSDANLACDLLPGNPAALLGRLFANHVAAGVYTQLGLADEADSLFEAAEADASALEPYSHLPSIARARAWYYLYTDREPVAFEILEQAATETNNARVAYRYALLLYRRGAFSEGFSVLDGRAQRSNNEELLRILLMMELPEGASRSKGAYRALEEKSSAGLAGLFRPALLLLLGDKPAAAADSRQLQERQPNQLPPLRRDFYERLLQFNCGDLDADQLLVAAGDSQWDLCEANFFIGLTRLAEGNRDMAAKHFQSAVAARCNGFLACDWSGSFLIRMAEDANWPRWIARGRRIEN
ncbi:MAG TPA: serine/threonine-protein kinase [Planctomycetaceae bacterium]|jgi:tetratricopeptide (TPR) repeat protein